MLEERIPCEFVSLICFCHMTSYWYGRQYLLCMCSYPTIDTNELSACKWILVSRINKMTLLCYKYCCYVCYQQMDEYVNSPIVCTNRLIIIVICDRRPMETKQTQIPFLTISMVTRMSFYSFSSHQATEQNITKIVVLKVFIFKI